MASLAIRAELYPGAWGVVAMDFPRDFTTIPPDMLITLSRQRVVDGSLLRLIKQRLQGGVAYQGRREPTTIGEPQGFPDLAALQQ